MGGWEVFSVRAGGTINDFHPTLSILEADVRVGDSNDGSDGKVHFSELVEGLDRISLDVGTVNADLFVDAFLGFLDYVDVDPNLPNRARGGDPFLIRSEANLSADLQTLDFENLDDFAFNFNRLELANPDVDHDGNDDYTTAVFLDNVIQAGESLINGTGVGDYLSQVLCIDDFVVPENAPQQTPNALDSGKVGEIEQRPRTLDAQDAIAAVGEVIETLVQPGLNQVQQPNPNVSSSKYVVIQ